MKIYKVKVAGKRNPRYKIDTYIAILSKGEGGLYLENKLDFSPFGVEECEVLFYFMEGRFKDEDSVWETEEFIFEEREEIENVCV